MNILVFSPYYPPHTGGLENHSSEWNDFLSKEGFRVTTFTPNLPVGDWGVPAGQKIIRYPAIEIIPNFPLPCFWKKAFWQAWQELQSETYDRVITRTRFFLSSLLGALFARWKKIPHLHIEHGSGFVILQNPVTTLLARVYDEIFGRIIFKLSTKNVAISQAVANFIHRFDKRAAPIIYRGLEFDYFQVIPQEKKVSDKIRLVTAARLYKWKGIAESIEAIRNLDPKKRVSIEFFVIGDGEDMDNLQKKAHGLPIFFCGRKTRRETFALLQSSDIYIHSSFPGGGLSTSLLEAMLATCAVIATPYEGADEVIKNGENGFLIQHRELSEKISFLVDNPELRQKLSLSARQSILENFSWPKSIKEYVKILNELKWLT